MEFLLDVLQCLHHAAYRQAHNIIKIAGDGFYTGHANPFLYGVGAGLVVGFVFFYIKTNLVECKFMKAYGGDIGK